MKNFHDNFHIIGLKLKFNLGYSDLYQGIIDGLN